ncbi:microfibril-associated glycoprotein 4-like isoform X1 [Neoarius graeffei]|uniref:microfibril-associated glycoprotein 4-like isoform X1 n=2 Tax=Neoarius graeffei TaxID=443677 RepID=UPI00298CD949|nr:microfibril-associated glycoprotein 4-like isoform X1 [Neoarius graeffei]
MNQVMLLLLMVAMSSLAHSAHILNMSQPLDCEDVYKIKINSNHSAPVPSGVYTIYPAGPNKPVKVYCDMGCAESDGHDDEKWTVIQRRIDGNESFYRPWDQYKEGFGNAAGEYWLGLENIFLMTNTDKYMLRVDMEDFEKGSAYAQYTLFYIDSESSKYRLHIGGYVNGGAGDSLSYVNGRYFSTFDKSYSGSCPETYNGGFWYNDHYYYYYYTYYTCHIANPNGLYKYGHVSTPNTGIIWQSWKNYYYSLKTITMKIRQIGPEDLERL